MEMNSSLRAASNRKTIKLILLLMVFLFCPWKASDGQGAVPPLNYLNDIKAELKKVWPDNRTINLVFHGHSVPSGYFLTPEVRTLESYPHFVLKQLKQWYPTAVINVITTAIGGENSESGDRRFERDVLTHRPDVVFIDYALNDRFIGLPAAKLAWESMIVKALKYGTKIILLTPSPDLSEKILSPDADLAAHQKQIIALAEKHRIGIVDCYESFRMLASSGKDLKDYMAQGNHINGYGHKVVADKICEYFK